MVIEIRKFRKHQKGTLVGFTNILMTTIGLEIRDVTLHRKDGQRWIGLPARPYVDANGETKYAYIVKFVDKDRWSRFQKEVLAAVDEYLADHDKSAAEIPDEKIPF